MPNNKPHALLMTVPALALLVGSCDSDPRLVELSREAADRQAQQNHEIIRVQHEVAEGAKNLVTADAAARKELVAVHQELQQERTVLGEGWNDLEAERRQIAQQRLTESRIGPIVQSSVAAVLVICVIGFCWSLLFGLRRQDDTDEILAELLVQEMVSDSPKLLPTPPPPTTQSRLPEPKDNDLPSVPSGK